MDSEKHLKRLIDRVYCIEEYFKCKAAESGDFDAEERSLRMADTLHEAQEYLFRYMDLMN